MARAAAASLALFAAGAAGHGYIVTPAARNKLACNGEFICLTDRETGLSPSNGRNLPQPVYPSNTAGYHPGVQIPNEPVCGAGHDDRVSDAMNAAFTNPGAVQGQYSAGECVTMTWQVAANHAGQYSYRLCLDGSDNEDCFQKTVLKNDKGQEWMPVDHNVDTYTDKICIPAGISCERCTLSWRWDGALESSVFTNCADISIRGSGPPAPPPPAPQTPPPTPPPPPPPAPSTPQYACILSKGSYSCVGVPAGTDGAGPLAQCQSACAASTNTYACIKLQSGWSCIGVPASTPGAAPLGQCASFCNSTAA